MKRFAIFGASGYGREVLPLVRQQLQPALAAGIADLVFVDDHPPAPAVNGQRVLTYAQWLSEPTGFGDAPAHALDRVQLRRVDGRQIHGHGSLPSR